METGVPGFHPQVVLLHAEMDLELKSDNVMPLPPSLMARIALEIMKKHNRVVNIPVQVNYTIS